MRKNNNFSWQKAVKFSRLFFLIIRSFLSIFSGSLFLTWIIISCCRVFMVVFIFRRTSVREGFVKIYPPLAVSEVLFFFMIIYLFKDGVISTDVRGSIAEWIIGLGIFLKSGAYPFHFWLKGVSLRIKDGLDLFVFLTIFKLPLFVFVSNFSMDYRFYILYFLRSFITVCLAYSSLSRKRIILIYLSVVSTGIFLLLLAVVKTFSVILYLLYFIRLGILLISWSYGGLIKLVVRCVGVRFFMGLPLGPVFLLKVTLIEYFSQGWGELSVILVFIFVISVPLYIKLINIEIGSSMIFSHEKRRLFWTIVFFLLCLRFFCLIGLLFLIW